MNNKLSITKVEEELDVETARSEIGAAFLKGLAGYAPFIGPLLAESIGIAIPAQKLDRLITFVKVLNDKVKYIEEDVLKSKLNTEEITDLLEDALIQASRAMTDPRRQYIASLLKNSIANEELSHIEEKKLLSLLGEMNDAEILTLKLYSLHSDRRREFSELHKELFAPIDRSFSAPQSNMDKGALRDSYRSKLLEVGLLEPESKRPEKGKLPEFDERTGRVKATSYKVASLGKLLLRYIDEVSSADA